MKKILHRLLLATPAALLVGALASPQAAMAIVPTVLTVPFVPGSPTTPHTTYPGANVILGATAPNIVSSADTFKAVWSFGDGSADVTISPITNPYDISTSHKFPTSAGTGTIWIATVTVTDSTTSQSASGNYYVIQEPSNLQIRVNVAIDWGLWYMHQTMWRKSTTVGSNTVQWGGWDGQTGAGSCNPVNGQTYDCFSYASIDAENVQAFEVNGHLASGPAADPYTDDVSRGLARMTNFIGSEAVIANIYQYNPAKAAYTCKDGSVPQTTDPLCASHGGQYFYNSGATSCTSPPCTIKHDGNHNGLMAYSNDGSGEYTYTTSPFLDALIDSNTPNAVALTGPSGILGAKYSDIVQDILDFYGYSQYGYDYDVSAGYTRGGAYSAQGGGWLYGPQQGDDNSTSQWAAIGYISGLRGSGIPIPPSITDFNQVWITNGQDVTDAKPTAADPFAANDNLGAFGYRGSFAYSNAWGPFAVTPSGMVQMAMDGIGRTTNTVFGDSTTAFDQRWNNTETYYADNFCNSLSAGAYYAPRAYMYGMFSFTKSMLLHDPSNNLNPIKYLRTLTPAVFTTNSSVPANTIDWYNALSPAHGGTDPCDGVAQTLVSLQNPDGHWFANDYYSYQYYYETAWALIMLKAVILHPCPADLQGRGTAKALAPARIDLTWSNESYASSYNVLRSTSSGGPYSVIGNTTAIAYSDRSGLTDGTTYYYVVDPLINTAQACQSNQATVKVPLNRAGH